MPPRKPWHALALALLIAAGPVLACGPDVTAIPATQAPSATPVAVTTAAPPGKCGDGVCDETEQQDPNLCPQDCPGAGGSAASPGQPPVPTTGQPDYEPPIHIFWVLHIDPSMDLGGAAFRADARFYQRSRDEIDWVMAEAARHNLHVTALYNGWFTKWALEQGDLAQFEALVAADHEIGSHAHRLIYDAERDLWASYHEVTDRYGRPNYDAEITSQCWAGADDYMDRVVAAIGAADQNRTMCAYPFMASDEGELMAEYGVTMAAGHRTEKAPAYFGHQVWNPWRPAASDERGHELDEDLRTAYVTLDHLAQIGRAESHGKDNTVAQLQRRFLMLYAEWLARERTGAEDRVWTFGFVHHPNYGDLHNAEITEFLDWLDEHFVGQVSPHGNVIARCATVAGIREAYLAWEAEHPGTSSFRYVLDDPYPYTCAAIPALLEGAAYEAGVALGPGVRCFKLSKDGQPIYLAWSDEGARTVDLSGELAGQVRVTNMAQEESTVDAAAVPLTEEPVLVEPAASP